MSLSVLFFSFSRPLFAQQSCVLAVSARQRNNLWRIFGLSWPKMCPKEGCKQSPLPAGFCVCVCVCVCVLALEAQRRAVNFTCMCVFGLL